MNDDGQSQQKLSVNVPIAALAVAVLIGLVGAAYALMSQQADEDEPVASKAKSGGNMRKKLGLMTLVTLIENDVTRKGVVALLKAMARRS